MFCTIQLSKSNPTPLYIQLAQELSKLIKTGSMPPNTKLPTIRSLSRKLHINRDTVVSAYKLLENQGLIISYVGNGTYVSSQTFSTTASPISSISCSSLSFPKNLFSNQLLQHIVHDIVSTEGWDAFADPLNREKNTIRECIACYLKSSGVEASSAHIRLVHQFSKFLLELLKFHPDHCICVEAYHDLTYTSFLRSMGIKLIEVPLTSEGMCIDTLEEILTTHPVSFIWVSPYMQNPTGITYSEKTKEKLLSLATQHNCYIIEDGTYSDFVYSDTLLKPLYTLDYTDRVIYLYHFSKLYLPCLQYSFVVLPKQLSLRIVDSIEYTFNERVLYFYLQSEAFDAIRLQLILKMHSFYTQILNTLHNYKNCIVVYEDKGGLFFWLKPLKLSSTETSSIFLKNHIVISPGELFSFKSQCPYFRLSLSQLTEDTLPLVIKSIEQLSYSIP